MATNNTGRRKDGKRRTAKVLRTQAIANDSRGIKNTKEIDEDTENFKDENTLDVDAEFLEVLVSSYDINSLQNIELSTKTNRKIKAIEMRMDRLFRDQNNSGNIKFNNIVALAQAYLYMSYIYTENENKKERLYIGESYLLRSLELLQDNILDRKAILIVLRALLGFASIYNTLEDPQGTKLFLHKAHQIYLAYTNEKDYPAPINIINVVSMEGIGYSRFHLNNLFEVILNALIHLHSSRCGYIDKHKTMMYRHKMLKNKLNQIAIFEHKDYIDWIKGSARLSECLAICGRFTEARDHLAAASLMLQKFDIYMDQNKNPDLCDVKYRRNFTSKYWARYGIELLRSSKNGLLHSKRDDKHCETSTLKSESLTNFKKQHTELIFSDLKEDLEAYIGLITDKCVVTSGEAVQISGTILKWLDEDIVDDDDLQERVRNMQDRCKVYKYLADFEQYDDPRMWGCNHVITILNTAISILNPEIQTGIYQQICIELAISYSAALRRYIKYISTNNTIDEAKDKLIINTVAVSAMQFFASYETISINNLSTNDLNDEVYTLDVLHDRDM